MKSKVNACLCIGLFAALFFSNCSASHRYNFSLKNTLAIFLLNNEKGYYFCIPVQYIGDYQIEKFEFTDGYVQIGDYKILLNREEVNISAYFNDPLTKKYEDDDNMNYYYIFIERFLKDNELKKIINEYKKENVNSKFFIEYDLVIDNEEQNGNGIYDDFELYDGHAMDTAWFPSNLNFFKAKYLQE